MNDEIKVGYYIRTKDGNIGTIKHKTTIHENDRFIRNEYRTSFNVYYYTDKQMQECGWKIKNNIIDLIEVNDYVNGRLVLQVDYKNKNICLLIPLTDTKANTNIMWYGYEDIKSIVTHQQFKSIEYIIHKREEKENA